MVFGHPHPTSLVEREGETLIHIVGSRKTSPSFTAEAAGKRKLYELLPD